MARRGSAACQARSVGKPMAISSGSANAMAASTSAWRLVACPVRATAAWLVVSVL